MILRSQYERISATFLPSLSTSPAFSARRFPNDSVRILGSIKPSTPSRSDNITVELLILFYTFALKRKCLPKSPIKIVLSDGIGAETTGLRDSFAFNSKPMKG